MGYRTKPLAKNVTEELATNTVQKHKEFVRQEPSANHSRGEKASRLLLVAHLRSKLPSITFKISRDYIPCIQTPFDTSEGMVVIRFVFAHMSKAFRFKFSSRVLVLTR